MKTPSEQKLTSNREEIANIARNIWQQEGCQPGRDLEYWLRAEHQLQAISKQASDQITSANPKSDGLAAKGKKGGPAARSTGQFQQPRS